MPDLMYARPGRTLLRVENETLGDIELVLERVNPNQANTPQGRIRTINTVNRGKRADQGITLQAGQYIYYAAALPELKGRLIVEEQ